MASDTALFDVMAEKLYMAAISDILDSLGLRNQVLQHGGREDLRAGHLLSEVYSKYRVF